MLGVTVPGVQDHYEVSVDGQRTALLLHPDGSWARATGTVDGPRVVHQSGPRRLWDIVDDICHAWLRDGTLAAYGPASPSPLTAVSSSRAGAGRQPSRPPADICQAPGATGPTMARVHGEVTVELSAYQRAASETNQLRLGGPQGVIAPMLVLASETGSILNVHKKYLRDGIDLAANRAFLREELGDLLWYAAAVATACGLDLEEAAEANLRRARDRYPASAPNPPSGGVICLFWMPATRRVSGSRAAWWWPSQSGYCRPAAVPPA